MTISKEQFGEWRQHPATKFFEKFLKDRKQALTNEGMELWIGLGEEAEGMEVRRGRILQLLEIEDISFDLIQSFYQEFENATEGIETIPR